jgi:hypothetical protein
MLRMAVGSHSQFDYAGQSQTGLSDVEKENFWISKGQPYSKMI